MTSFGSRGASWFVSAFFCLLLASLGGRQLAATGMSPTVVPVDGATLSSASDYGFLAVAARAPVPEQATRLLLGAALAIGTAALFLLGWTAALAALRGRLVLDTLGVRYRRRGPPALVGT
jgi:hypothetical protein